MQHRSLLISSALISTAFGQIDATVTPVPSVTKSSTCTQKACATYTNACGKPYGGCFPACPGHTIPAFAPPPCPTTSSASSSTSYTCPTVCWDLINSCDMWYGGCSPMCGSYSMPSFTPPPCPSTTPLPVTITGASRLYYSNATTSRCSRTVCWDYQNECGLKYGGCHADCEGIPAPSYINPGCPSNSTSTKSFVTQTSQECGMYCPIYVDGCGNSFGPGCYTSCPGAAPPAFTTPYCQTSAVTTATILVTTTS